MRKVALFISHRTERIPRSAIPDSHQKKRARRDEHRTRWLMAVCDGRRVDAEG